MRIRWRSCGFWLASNRRSLTPKPLADAIAAYLRYLEAIERERSYRKHVETHLKDFAAEMGNAVVHEVTPQASG